MKSHEYKTIFCNNCGKSGHLFHQCKLPITSIGIIVIRKKHIHNTCNDTCNDINMSKYEVLLICRKNSLGFVDFMRGKYNINNRSYIQNLLEKMTIEEKRKIQTCTFDELWQELWGININNQYKNEEKISRDKLANLKRGNTRDNYDFNTLLEESSTSNIDIYDEPEWGFPKGRRNFGEKDLNCALREFEEETGFSRHDIKIIYNIFPLEEIYIGSNYKAYKHKYFIAILNDDEQLPRNEFQETEISKIEWVDINNAKTYFRDYNLEKIELMDKVSYIVQNYNMFFEINNYT